jgi:hypothetical protein
MFLGGAQKWIRDADVVARSKQPEWKVGARPYDV